MATAEETEPSETYLQKMTTRRNTMTAARHARGDNTRNIPAAVATPLPPLNFSQTGKQCPSKAANAAIIIQVAASFESFLASKTAPAPLATSSTKVNTPARNPAARATLVAP